MPSLDSVRFDTSGYELQEDDGGAKFWLTDQGDALSFYYFPNKSDPASNPRDIDLVRRTYRDAAVQSNGAIIEVESLVPAGLEATRCIMKFPQETSGMTYEGFITLPYRDFSFMINVTCPERADPGVRDSVVLSRRVRDGSSFLREDGGIDDWWRDPYEPDLVAAVLRNASDDVEFDSEFPDHPLSRMRSVLDRVQGSLLASDEVMDAPVIGEVGDL